MAEVEEQDHELGAIASEPTPTVTANGASAETVEIDDDVDSAYGEDGAPSDTTSLASSLVRGRMENGRKYASLRDDYWGPTDEKQLDTMDLCHLAWLIIFSGEENTLFRAPITNPKSILDLGTGTGTWAIDVADGFPDATVHGVDLFPPRNLWVPPNCYLEVEDVSKEWTWEQKFDLIHIRYLIGSLTKQEWADLYKRAYDSLEPGGWIEQAEPDCRLMCDDNSIPPESPLWGWANTLYGCSEKMGRSLKTIDEMREGIEKAGFINVKEEYLKLPFGPWAKNLKLKEAGRLLLEMCVNGLEGYALHFLTNYGSPTPWSKDEVYVYTAKIRAELLNPKRHVYHYNRRVWAQKPPSGDSTSKT